jgi:hypothetical protein
MKTISSIHAEPLFKEDVVFGLIPLVNSDWDGPIEVNIYYDDGSSDNKIMFYEEYSKLKMEKKDDDD